MTFDEANKLIEGSDPYWFGKEERKALESFGIGLTHAICEKCDHMPKGCNAINCYEDFVITTCNYFQRMEGK